MAAMMYNPACYCLLNGTVCIQPLKENYQPPECLKSFIPESMKEVWGMVIQASRYIHKVIGVMERLIGLKCALTPSCMAQNCIMVRTKPPMYTQQWNISYNLLITCK